MVGVISNAMYIFYRKTGLKFSQIYILFLLLMAKYMMKFEIVV